MLIAYAAAKRGPSVGRIRTAAIPGGAPRADPAAEQPLAPRRNSSEISLASGRRAPGQTETLRWRFASDALALRKRSPFRRITPRRHVARRIRQGGRLRLNAGRAYASSGVDPAFPVSLMLWRNGAKRRLAFVSPAVPRMDHCRCAARSIALLSGLRQTRRLLARGRWTPFAHDRCAGPTRGVASLHPVVVGPHARFVSCSRPPRVAPLRALHPRAARFTHPHRPASAAPGDQHENWPISLEIWAIRFSFA